MIVLYLTVIYLDITNTNVGLFQAQLIAGSLVAGIQLVLEVWLVFFGKKNKQPNSLFKRRSNIELYGKLLQAALNYVDQIL